MPTLFSVAEEIRTCTACPLYKNTTLAVPGDGPNNVKIMILGEAPGEEENRQGLPFVGRSGKYLDTMLQTACISRKDVFITNCVKHRPPQNRKPNAQELKVCTELWLDKQIKLIKPELIILLGSVALKTLVNETSIEKWHGKSITRNGQKYFISYHPAAALRFPEIRQLMAKDFEKLKKLIS